MKTTFFFAIVGALTFVLHTFGAQESRPNIVFVLADDLGYGDLSCYNADSKVETPNLDRLANSGIRFTDAHSGASVCSPTRYGLLTGRHFLRRPNWIEGILNRCLIDEQQLTVAEYLRANGYHTACFGKWHLGQTWFDKKGQPTGANFKTDYTRPTQGGPNDHGFDYFFGMNGTAVGSPLSLMENRLVTEVPTVKGPKKGRPMAKFHRAVDVMLRTTERALDYIDTSVKERKGQPFFIYYALTAVHTPIVPAKQYKGKSDASDYGDFVYQVDDAVLSTFYGKPVIRKDSWVLMPFLEGGGPYSKNAAESVDGGPQGQLFDLSQDAGQKNNIWLEHPEVVTELTRLHAEHVSRGRSVGIGR